MEGVRRYFWIFLLVVLSVCLETFAKGVKDINEGILAQTYRCSCSIEVETTTRGRLAHDYGVINTYDESPPKNCKDIRRQCRDDCQQRAQLNKYITDDHSDNHDKLGYTLCRQYGMPTFGQALDTLIQASVAECPGHRPIKAKHEKVCCGLTPIPMSNSKSVQALGWDRECNGVTYVV